jgi:hypothetical protein
VVGENGRDRLYGDAGNDGLFGGTGDGRDTMTGGSGSDRFLSAATKGSGQTYTREDVTTDAANGIDVAPTFVHGYNYTKTFSPTETDTFTAKYWTDADILRADDVLALLHKEGNGSKLLTRGGVGNIIIVRHGSTYRGFNEGGWIHMTDAIDQFGGSDNDLHGYLLHEIGHNWQGDKFKASGVNFWNQFIGTSGWTPVDPNDPVSYNVSTNEGRGNRWYLKSATFASDYARTNENEDFAESFAAYFSARARWPFYNGPGANAIPAKMILFLDWAAKIANGG